MSGFSRRVGRGVGCALVGVAAAASADAIITTLELLNQPTIAVSKAHYNGCVEALSPELHRVVVVVPAPCKPVAKVVPELFPEINGAVALPIRHDLEAASIETTSSVGDLATSPFRVACASLVGLVPAAMAHSVLKREDA